MHAAFYLLTLVGMIGSYDVLYYHVYKLKLYRHHDAMWENVTHMIRAILFAVMMLAVLHLDARGWWWLLYPALLGFELTNTLTDVIMEPHTRRNLGGLPPVEYVLHIALSLLTGAALASVIWGTYERAWEPSVLNFDTLEVAWYVLAGAYSSILIAVGMFVFEFVGFCRLYVGRHTAGAPAELASAGGSSARRRG